MGWLEEQSAQASPDLLRAMVTTFVEALRARRRMRMRSAAPAAVSTATSAPTPVRAAGVGYPGWQDRFGDPEAAAGQILPDWLLERRRRAETALVTVVATSYLLGVSTPRMEKLVEVLGITRLSKSKVSEIAKDLDAQVEAGRTRPLDAGPYTFVAADALVLKVREGGRIVNVHGLLATGVNAEGYHSRSLRRGSVGPFDASAATQHRPTPAAGSPDIQVTWNRRATSLSLMQSSLD